MTVVVDDGERAAIGSRQFAIALEAPSHALEAFQARSSASSEISSSMATATADRALSTLCSPGRLSTTSRSG
jgi:hypothetical protein